MNLKKKWYLILFLIIGLCILFHTPMKSKHPNIAIILLIISLIVSDILLYLALKKIYDKIKEKHQLIISGKNSYLLKKAKEGKYSFLLRFSLLIGSLIFIPIIIIFFSIAIGLPFFIFGVSYFQINFFFAILILILSFTVLGFMLFAFFSSKFTVIFYQKLAPYFIKFVLENKDCKKINKGMMKYIEKVCDGLEKEDIIDFTYALNFLKIISKLPKFKDSLQKEFMQELLMAIQKENYHNLIYLLSKYEKKMEKQDSLNYKILKTKLSAEFNLENFELFKFLKKYADNKSFLKNFLISKGSFKNLLSGLTLISAIVTAISAILSSSLFAEIIQSIFNLV